MGEERSLQAQFNETNEVTEKLGKPRFPASSPRFVIDCVILRKSLYLSEPSCTYLPKAESSKVLCV